MPKSIFEALYYGKISPYSRPNVSSPERRERSKKLQSEKEYFTGNMSSDHVKRFNNLEDLLTLNSLDENVNIFSNGFVLGALFAFEIMERREGVINE